jgi:hypothetical protein
MSMFHFALILLVMTESPFSNAMRICSRPEPPTQRGIHSGDMLQYSGSAILDGMLPLPAPTMPVGYGLHC